MGGLDLTRMMDVDFQNTGANLGAPSSIRAEQSASLVLPGYVVVAVAGGMLTWARLIAMLSQLLLCNVCPKSRIGHLNQNVGQLSSLQSFFWGTPPQHRLSVKGGWDALNSDKLTNMAFATQGPLLFRGPGLVLVTEGLP
jgi:hypothetical protein